MTDSNRRPPPCKSGALPTELIPLKERWEWGKVFLSIAPFKGGDPAAPSGTATLLRLHPNRWFHLRQLRPLRVRPLASGVSNFHGVTGGVYKARERIHPGVADPGLLATPASWSRVADSNPNWDRLSRFASHRCVAALCTGHCITCVAQGVRAVMIWRHPHLPLYLRRQSH